MKKETAVQWLLKQFDETYHIKDKFLPSDWDFLEETAKELEASQIIQAYENGTKLFHKFNAEQYYNDAH